MAAFFARTRRARQSLSQTPNYAKYIVSENATGEYQQEAPSVIEIGDSKLMISLAFQQLAQNAEKIGELNISPELLNTLLRPGRAGTKE